MRSWTMWIMHGDRQWPGGALLRHTCRVDRSLGSDDTGKSRHTGETSSDSKGIHRRTGDAVRLLHQRRHHDREGVTRSQSPRHGYADSAGHGERALPMRRELAHHDRHSQICTGDEAVKTMKRRDFLKATGVLTVGFSLRGVGELAAQAPGFNGTGSNALDSWLAIAADGSVTVYTGKCELGTGLYTAQVQLIAEELCVPLNRVKLIQCDTALTPDQGTTSGAQSHPTNFNQANLAQACATAREALKQLASTRLAISADRLDVK